MTNLFRIETKHNMLHNLQNDDNTITTMKRRIPVLSYVSAGYATSAEAVEYAEEFIEIPFEIKDPNAFALKIFGDSMYPRYMEGDYVIASPLALPRNRQPVIAMINNDETTCKLYQEQKDHICLIPENPRYQMIICDKKDVAWVFPVVALYRKED
ncbi:S24 family peptidase [bacterium]|nr:S24 family peptidase [bacterium]